MGLLDDFLGTIAKKLDGTREIAKAGRVKENVVQPSNAGSKKPAPSVKGHEDELAPILCTLTADTTSQLNVLRHDRHSLGMDGTQIGVLEQTHQISFCSLLYGKNSVALKPQITKKAAYLEVLSNFPNKALEWQFPDQELSALLVLPNFTIHQQPFLIRHNNEKQNINNWERGKRAKREKEIELYQSTSCQHNARLR
ncbi:hypothetical protein G4B88_024504 [Cannabis sativa]|uniref:Uncharacterized protein n=1 Tax=Cannabis sativa TaxID=3483 RepID=A0A7J6EU78_CANSA|nr:hypothetical protein G4B88_024504 [Cannabis sativa]